MQISRAAGQITISLQRVEDDDARAAIVETVSREQHRLHLEQAELSRGIRASQEESMLEYVLSACIRPLVLSACIQAS